MVNITLKFEWSYIKYVIMSACVFSCATFLSSASILESATIGIISGFFAFSIDKVSEWPKKLITSSQSRNGGVTSLQSSGDAHVETLPQKGIENAKNNVEITSSPTKNDSKPVDLNPLCSCLLQKYQCPYCGASYKHCKRNADCVLHGSSKMVFFVSEPICPGCGK